MPPRRPAGAGWRRAHSRLDLHAKSSGLASGRRHYFSNCAMPLCYPVSWRLDGGGGGINGAPHSSDSLFLSEAEKRSAQKRALQRECLQLGAKQQESVCVFCTVLSAFAPASAFAFVFVVVRLGWTCGFCAISRSHWIALPRLSAFFPEDSPRIARNHTTNPASALYPLLPAGFARPAGLRTTHTWHVRSGSVRTCSNCGGAEFTLAPAVPERVPVGSNVSLFLFSLFKRHTWMSSRTVPSIAPSPGLLLSSPAYADRQLVPEEAHRSLALYRAVLSSPSTDTATRLACLAKSASVLDGLQSVREFDLRHKNSAKKHKKMKQLSASGGGTGDGNLRTPAAAANSLPPSWQILFDRAATYRDIATAYRLLGDAQNAAFNAERSATLFETLIYATPSLAAQQQPSTAQLPSPGNNIDDGSGDVAASRVFAINTLLQVLGDWVVMEQALGRGGKAEKLQQRISKWRSER
ncbi:hypothetical protein GQ54DRAFT_99680 [Martensiomyces pterosporus]|nr:hypothetical protein GQ54DRAFT_99680 [Martensiomyces pterosporus]